MCRVESELLPAVHFHKSHGNRSADRASGGAEGTEHGRKHAVILLFDRGESNRLIRGVKMPIPAPTQISAAITRR
jgi:hypothetical protein